MTLKEVAEKAGVSISTASRVINGKSTKTASPQVKQRILRVAEELGYAPNRSAQALKLGEDAVEVLKGKRSIGCIFGRVMSSVEDPFFSRIAKAVEKEIAKHGCVMKYSFSASDIESEEELRKLLEGFRLDGAVILGRLNRNFYSMIRDSYPHVVYTGLNSISPDFDQVICDGYSAALTAVHYLYTIGHRKIGYVGEKSNEDRFKGYFDALSELELEYDKDIVIQTRLSSDSGYSAVSKLLGEGCIDASALFCANDATAIGVAKALKDKGLRVPEDVSVIGIDDIDISRYMSPSLSTVHIPLEEMGRATGRLLMDRLENGSGLPMKIELPYTLIRRESCKDIKPANRSITEENEEANSRL
jgi:DNA-binding LacI/PurR family transcriptional regulator